MRILGIDPGLQITGYACVELDAVTLGADPSLVEAGVFRLPTRAPMARRLAELYRDLRELLGQVEADVMVVEKLFSHYRHARTSIQMGHARGVVLLCGQLHDVAVQELAATEVKKAVTGNGHATKQQVQHAVMSQCSMTTLPEPHDLADAIAIALCAARRLSLESA